MKNKKRIFVLALVICLGTAYVMNFSTLGQPVLKQFGSGEGMLDMNFFYTGEQAAERLSSMGEEGKHFYTRILYIDFLFIASFAYVKAELMLWLIQLLKLPDKYKKWSIFSYIRGLFDLVENILILTTLHQKYINPTLLSVAGVITILKWLSMIIFFILLTLLIVFKVVDKKRLTT